MVRFDVGLLRIDSVRMIPVSVALLDAVASLASCPVAIRRLDIEGIP